MAPQDKSAVILAGGRSARMGTDKASLAWGGATIVEAIAAELARGFADLVVITGTHGVPHLAAAVIRDAEPFRGPVPALRRGLDAVHAPFAFVCACDLPLLKAEVALALYAMAFGYDAAIPVVGNQPQVLAAVYAKGCMPALDAMIARGEHRLREIVGLINARMVSEDELRPYDPELTSFLNVNTPQDYARALRLARSSR